MQEPKEPADFLSCDWGTTSFRLRWVSGSDRTVIREIRESAGIKALHEQAARSGATTLATRSDVFARFLSAKLEALLVGEPSPKRPIPLVISGMASSSIGWRELPYAKVPFRLDGRGLCAEEIVWNKPPRVGPTFLISGMSTGHDIMRGEETEIIGLMSDSSLTVRRQRALLILPGTHSKHVEIENDSVVDFRTFMTGELFEVLGQHSILRASVDLDSRSVDGAMSDVDRAAFQDGVGEGAKRGLAGSLFRVRTRAVLDRQLPGSNTWFLSGLLIGAELESIARGSDNRPVILAAASGLSELYKLALEIVVPASVEWMQVPPERVERAVIAAHGLFLENRVAEEME